MTDITEIKRRLARAYQYTLRVPRLAYGRTSLESTGGDLLDLWCAVKGLTLSQAIEAARDYLGMQRQKAFMEPKKQFLKPPVPKGEKPHAVVLDYLREVRNIPAEVIEKYRVGENGREIIFQFYKPTKELALIKSRTAEDGAKPKPTSANCEPILFGWQAIPENAREIVITEGEIDALSLAAYGYNALSVPFGGGKGGKQNWIENEYDNLERFEKIFIATDMDEVGEEAANEIASRLGRHRCYRVELPEKDANECLMCGIDGSVIEVAFKKARSLDPEGLRRASDYTDKVVNLFWPKPEEREGYSVPYGKISDKLHFRPAELTLWSGSSGAGKSQILSDCIPHWIQGGSRLCLASLEMKGEQSLRRLSKQTGGVDRPTEEYIHKIMGWLDQGLLIYEHVGKAGVDALLDVFNYARAKYGCDQFVIDSLMRLGIASDDYTGQEKQSLKLWIGLSLIMSTCILWLMPENRPLIQGFKERKMLKARLKLVRTPSTL